MGQGWTGEEEGLQLLGCTIISLLTPGGCGIYEGNLLNWWGSGGLGSPDGLARLGFPFAGLGICDLCSDGPDTACSLWDCTDGPGKHCCLWDCGDGLAKHCCLWESALCWAGGRFKCIGHTCSLVLQYFLPWPSIM